MFVFLPRCHYSYFFGKQGDAEKLVTYSCTHLQITLAVSICAVCGQPPTVSDDVLSGVSTPPVKAVLCCVSLHRFCGKRSHGCCCSRCRHAAAAACCTIPLSTLVTRNFPLLCRLPVSPLSLFPFPFH